MIGSVLYTLYRFVVLAYGYAIILCIQPFIEESHPMYDLRWFHWWIGATDEAVALCAFAMSATVAIVAIGYALLY